MKTYKAQEISSEKSDEYLHKQNLPKIIYNHRLILNGPMTIRELCEAIKKIKTGKLSVLERSRRADGFLLQVF